MIPRLKVLGLAILIATVWLAVLGTLAADKKKDNKDDARRREIARLDDQIHRGQQKLETLRRQETTLKGQVDGMEKKLPDLRKRAKDAEGDLATAKGEMGESQKSIDKAEAAVKQATLYVNQIVKQLEDGQPEGSAFAKARAAYLAAKTVYEQALDAAGNAPAYKEALERAKASPDRATLFPAVRKQFIDGNPAVVEARADLGGKKTVYEELRTQLLNRDQGWRDASQTLTRAKTAEIEAEQQGRAKAAKQTATAAQLADAKRDAKTGETALAQAQSQLKKIPGMRQAIERELDRDRRDRQRLR